MPDGKDDNGWNDYKLLILEQLKTVSKSLESLDRKIDRVETAVAEVDKKVAVMETRLSTVIGDHARIEKLEVEFSAQKVRLSIMLSMLGFAAGLGGGALMQLVFK